MGALREEISALLRERQISAGRVQRDPTVRDGGFNRRSVFLIAAASLSELPVDDLDRYGNDVGLNTNNVPFIGRTITGCGSSFTVTNAWIRGSNINLINGANNISACGSIDANTIFQNIGTVTIPSGATDASHHF